MLLCTCPRPCTSHSFIEGLNLKQINQNLLCQNAERMNDIHNNFFRPRLTVSDWTSIFIKKTTKLEVTKSIFGLTESTTSFYSSMSYAFSPTCLATWLANLTHQMSYRQSPLLEYRLGSLRLTYATFVKGGHLSNHLMSRFVLNSFTVFLYPFHPFQGVIKCLIDNVLPCSIV